MKPPPPQHRFTPGDRVVHGNGKVGTVLKTITRPHVTKLKPRGSSRPVTWQITNRAVLAVEADGWPADWRHYWADKAVCKASGDDVPYTREDYERQCERERLAKRQHCDE